MGDADSTQIVMSAAEIEQWMDDALNDMDEGLNVLFSFMNLLNQRTVQMMSELMAWHRFRRCFAALNLFAVPILLAIGIVYGTSQVLEHSMSGIESGLQSIVAFLMFLSWSIGFPLYVFSFWKTYFDKSELVHVSTERDRSGVWNHDKSSAGESNLTLPLVEESLLDIGRMINKRMRDGIRQEFERRMNEAVEIQAVIDLTSADPASSETSDSVDEEVFDRNQRPETAWKFGFSHWRRKMSSHGCLPRKCDHHCARVCRQYACTCDYRPGSTTRPEEQRLCCEWEWVHRPRSGHYAYTDDDAEVDTLTRYFGVQRSLRDPHDPLRFTGINHVPRWLHTDYSSLDVDYSNILREREITAACRYSGPGSYYTYRSMRPWNRPPREQAPNAGCSRLNERDEGEARRELLRNKMAVQRFHPGQMHLP